jgi:hypothetical protein
MPSFGEDNRLPTHAKARVFLEDFARRRIPITYQALAKALQILPPHSIHQVTEALECLTEEDAAADRPFIAALAISKARRGLPAPGSSTAPDVSAGSQAIRTVSGKQVLPVRLSTYREEAAPMRSQPLPGEASRRRAEEQFKTTKKVNSETTANTPSRQAEAAKTARLRALRLAKEAADKDTANQGAAAAKARRSEPRQHVRRPQASTPEPK